MRGDGVTAVEGDPEASQGALGLSPARLGAFSDGILAIAATLLILDVRTRASGEPVWSSLRAEWPALAAYASTFLIIGIVWIHHHNLFHQVRAVDRTLLFLNLGMLLTIAFLPLPTATLGNHLGGSDGEAAAVFYGLSMSIASGWFVLFWHHLARHPLLLDPAARSVAPARRRGALIGPASFLLATAAALLSPYATVAVSALVIAYFIVGPGAPSAATRVGGA
jgi:TMEM175 potassium channel family protein